MYICKNVYMYVCIYVCLFVCMYIFMYIYIYMYACVYYVFMHVCMYVFMYVCMYAYIYVCIYMYVCIYVCVYVCICLYYTRDIKPSHVSRLLGVVVLHFAVKRLEFRCFATNRFHQEPKLSFVCYIYVCTLTENLCSKIPPI